MSKSTEIVAALGDISAIKSYATLQAEMVELFTDMADCERGRSGGRPEQILRKMAATVDTIPYDVLVEFDNYDAALIASRLLLWVWNDAPDYTDAHHLVLTLVDDLRSINLDHPQTRMALKMLDTFFESFQDPPVPPDQ
jgi:hypothetical protein